jgi:hypothetical protein
MPEVSREKGEGPKEAKRWGVQAVQTHGNSGERVENQDQLPARTVQTGQTGGRCRSDRWPRDVAQFFFLRSYGLWWQVHVGTYTIKSSKCFVHEGSHQRNPISSLLVGRGAIVNLMSYSLFKKLGGSDYELIKANMTVALWEEVSLWELRSVVSMELTVGSKMLPTAFFIAETQGNLSLILDHDWIHAN